MIKITGTIIWLPAFPLNPADLPDANLEVLVFDKELDDTVKGYRDADQCGRHVWIDQVTGDPLPAPLFWTDVPYPGE